MDELAGRVAVVTGAASGIGRAMATLLAANGMRLVIADIEQSALDATEADLRESGAEVLARRVDVSQPDQIQTLAQAATQRFDRVHLLCQNAGVEGYLDGAIWEASDNDWTWTFGVNFWSLVHGVRAFVPAMIAHGEPAHIVNTASMTSVVRAGNMYGITKQAVLALSEVLDKQLRERGSAIGVTALCPGTIATRLFQGSRNRPAQLSDPTSAPDAVGGRELRERMHATLAEGMDPADVAQCMVAAVRAGTLYALTDHEWDDRIRERVAAILGADERY